MVDVCWEKVTSVMTGAAVDTTVNGVSMNCRVCNPSGSSRYMIAIMAGFARLCFFIYNVVIKCTAKIE
jgi:hypothetical protein